jgi:hypothetical protein
LYFLTRVADETGLALFPGVLDEVLVFLVGVQDVAVLADVLLAADVTHVLLVPVFAVTVFVLQKLKHKVKIVTDESFLLLLE